MTAKIPIEAFTVFASGLDHPECLAFDREGFLWAGGEAGQIYRIAPDGRVETIAILGSFCAGLAFSPRDQLLVCNASLGIVRVENSGAFSVFADGAGDHKFICPNFGVFDSKGNYFVTDSGNWGKHNGRLLRFTPDGRGKVIGGPFGYANGLALSADEGTLFMVESDTDSVWRFELRGDDTIGRQKVFARHVGRFPDGLALDAEGNLYACCYASDEIWRISPPGEKTLIAWDYHAIRLGSPTNMAFGGANLDELYVANLARTTITRARVDFRGQPLANLKRSAGASPAGLGTPPNPLRKPARRRPKQLSSK